MSHRVDLANATYLPTGEKLATCQYGTCTWKTIQTGDRIRIDWEDAFAYSWGEYQAPALGEPVNIEVYDSASGKMIVTVQTTVLP